MGLGWIAKISDNNNVDLFACITTGAPYDGSPYNASTIKFAPSLITHPEINQVIVLKKETDIPLIIVTPAATVNGEQNVSLTYQIPVTITDGVAGTFTLSSGSLPAGLSLNSSTGIISGTPTSIVSGTVCIVTISAQNAVSKTITLTFNIESQYPVITLAKSSDTITGIVNTAIQNYQISATVTKGAALSFNLKQSNDLLVSGAYLDTCNGVYILQDSSKTGYNRVWNKSDNTMKIYSGSVWMLSDINKSTTYYIGHSGGDNPLSATWTTASGPSPAPIVIQIDNSLPSGLSLNTTSGIISGIPLVSSPVSSIIQVSAINAETKQFTTVFDIKEEELPKTVTVTFYDTNAVGWGTGILTILKNSTTVATLISENGATVNTTISPGTYTFSTNDCGSCGVEYSTDGSTWTAIPDYGTSIELTVIDNETINFRITI